MRMNIPELGTEITLLADWQFKLYAESRNKSLLVLNGIDKDVPYDPKLVDTSTYDYTPARKAQYDTHIENMKKVWQLEPFTDKSWDGSTYSGWNMHINATIPKDTKMIVDRIYIRKGASEYSSVSFRAIYNKKKCRFWAKLSDVNTIEYE